MSFEEVSQKLEDLQESNKQLQELTTRLATFKFKPGSIPLRDEEDDSVVGELKTEIRQLIKDQFDDFALLKEDVADLNAIRYDNALEAQKTGLQQAVLRGENEVKRHQNDYRKAVLLASNNMKAAKRAEYLILLNSACDPQPRSDTSSPAPESQHRRTRTTQLTQEEREMNASSDVTSALRRTHDMMASELSRSRFAHDTLRESTAALTQLGERYSIIDTMLSSSRNLLGTLLKSQKSDTWYLETAFYVLCATIAWLLFRRILYGPLWWFVWFPIRIFWRSLIGVLTGVGLIGRTSTSAVSTSMDAVVTPPQSVLHQSATRATRPIAPPKVSVNVGGGGRGMPAKGPPGSPGNMEGGESLSEQVGNIIDGIQGKDEFDAALKKDALEERNPEAQIPDEVSLGGTESPQYRKVKDEL